MINQSVSFEFYMDACINPYDESFKQKRFTGFDKPSETDRQQAIFSGVS